MIRIDIDKVMEKVGSQMSIGDQRTVRLVIEAINDSIVYDEPVFAIYNSRDERMWQYGTGSWNTMKHYVLDAAIKGNPNAGFHLKQV